MRFNHLHALLIGFALCAGATFVLADDSKPADVSGAWKWTATRPDGQSVDVILTLKQDGEKITGTYHGQGPDSEVTDGSVHGNDMRFTVEREIEGHKVKLEYSGKVDGNTVKGQVEAKVRFRDKKEDW